MCFTEFWVNCCFLIILLTTSSQCIGLTFNNTLNRKFSALKYNPTIQLKLPLKKKKKNNTDIFNLIKENAKAIKENLQTN